ncbi:MAG: HNH endonuclease [Halofilum sp. (in: g-proteobacteria)]|nr:HNH endonuclease [Halofilum sp. (in: g-proteobacteria)]
MNWQPMILKTDPGGRPIRWIDVRLAAGYMLRDEVAWASDAIAVVLRGGTSARSGLRSRIDIPSIVAVAGARAKYYDATVPRLTNAALFLRDRHLCCYCGDLFQGRSALLTRDHVMPLSRGGSDAWDNVVTSCRACNQKKDDRLVEECGLEMLYIPYTPSRAEAMILENRRILADQMDYLMAQVPRRDRRRKPRAIA